MNAFEKSCIKLLFQTLDQQKNCVHQVLTRTRGKLGFLYLSILLLENAYEHFIVTASELARRLRMKHVIINILIF